MSARSSKAAFPSGIGQTGRLSGFPASQGRSISAKSPRMGWTASFRFLLEMAMQRMQGGSVSSSNESAEPPQGSPSTRASLGQQRPNHLRHIDRALHAAPTPDSPAPTTPHRSTTPPAARHLPLQGRGVIVDGHLETIGGEVEEAGGANAPRGSHANVDSTTCKPPRLTVRRREREGIMGPAYQTWARHCVK